MAYLFETLYPKKSRDLQEKWSWEVGDECLYASANRGLLIGGGSLAALLALVGFYGVFENFVSDSLVSVLDIDATKADHFAEGSFYLASLGLTGASIYHGVWGVLLRMALHSQSKKEQSASAA